MKHLKIKENKDNRRKIKKNKQIRLKFKETPNFQNYPPLTQIHYNTHNLFQNKGYKMKNLTQLGVASALIGASLLFSACGGSDEFKPSSEAEKQVVNLIKNKSADTKILSFDTVQKEFGLKDRECLKDKEKNTFGYINDFLFIKMPNGEIQVREISINDETKNGMLSDIISIEQIKSKKPECFN